MRQAWKEYTETVAENYARNQETEASASNALSSALQSTALEEAAAKTQAYEDAFNDSIEVPDEGSITEDYAGTITECHGHEYDPPYEVYYYEREDGARDVPQCDSPPEHLAAIKAEFEIDKRFAPKYEQILNDYSETVENSRKERDVANANAWREVWRTVYNAQERLAVLGSEHRHELFQDRLEDGYELTVAIAEAGEQLQKDLSTAVLTRDQGIADAAHTRDYTVATAGRTKESSIATAGNASTQAWTASLGTLWAGYQSALANNENDYKQGIAGLEEARDQAYADATRQESYSKAQAAKSRSDSLAEAEKTRTIGLAGHTKDLQVGQSEAYTDLGSQLAMLWYDRQDAGAELLAAYSVTVAEFTAEHNIEYAKAEHKFGTATEDPLYHSLGAYGEYDGWASNGVIYGPWWYGDVREVADTRQAWQDLSNELQLTKAQVDRDRAIDMADAVEVRDIGLIDATETYRKEVHQRHRDYSVDLTGLSFTYQVDVATAQSDYNVSVAEAAAEYAIDYAKATAQRVLSYATADGALSNGDAGLTYTHEVGDAGEESVYRVAEATNYVAVLTAWAGGVVTPWEAYQGARALAEVDRVTSVGNAEVAYAVAKWASNTLWVQSSVAAQLGYTTEIYSPSGAYVDRVQIIADAQVEIASNGSLLDFVTDQAEAVKSHDIGVADANLTFYDAAAEAYAVAGRENERAEATYARDIARAVFAANKPDGISPQEYDRRTTAAWKKKYEREVRAGSARVVTVATARRNWTYEVSDLNVQLVTDLVAAQNGRAADLREEIVGLASATSSAQQQYDVRDATASGQASVSVASAEAADSVTTAIAGATKASLLQTASGVYSVAADSALGGYEVTMHQSHVASLGQVAQQGGSPLAAYQHQTAIADLAAAVLIASARYLYTQATAAHEAAETAAANTANVASAQKRAETSVQYTEAHTAADAALASGLAGASAALYVAKKTAEADLMVAATSVQGKLDTAIAEAVRERDNAFADAGLEWVIAAEEARVHQALEEISDSEYQAAMAAASQARIDAKAAADKAYQEAVDEASVEALKELGEAKVEYVDTVGEASTQYVTAAGTATVANAESSGQASIEREIADTLFEQELRIVLGQAELSRTLLDDGAELTRLATVRDVLAVRGGERGLAEAGYHLSVAEQQRDYWVAASAAQPSSDYLAFRAIEALVVEAWFTELVTPYGEYRYAMSFAFAEGARRLAEAVAVRAAGRGLGELQESIALGWQSRGRSLAILTAETANAVTIAGNESTLSMSVATAEHAIELAKVTADVAREQTLDGIDRQFRDDLYGEEADEARREAQYARATAFANSDHTWRNATASAENSFAVGEGNRIKALTSGHTSANRNYKVGSVQLDAARELAFAFEEGAYWVAEAESDSLVRNLMAQAEAEFLSADHAARVEALSDFAVAFPAVSGEVEGIAVGYAVGDLAFQANQYDGQANPGEFSVSGSFVTRHAADGGGALAAGDLGDGVAASDAATGTGYIMYSAQSVHTRFSSSPPEPGASHHFIAVKFVGGVWHYDNNNADPQAALVAFTPVSSDLLVAEVDFSSDQVTDLGGYLPWSLYELNKAIAEADAWEDAKEAFLQWHEDIGAAIEANVASKGDVYVEAMADSALLSREARIAFAAAEAGSALGAALVQQTYAGRLASDVLTYRQSLATATLTRDLGAAEATRDGESDGPLNQQFNDTVNEIEDDYRRDVVLSNIYRRQELARTGMTLTTSTASIEIERAFESAQIVSDFELALVDLYYSANGSGGVEAELAELEYNYTLVEADAYSDAMQTLATGNGSPWAALAGADAAAHEAHIAGPLAELQRSQRRSVAYADRQFNITTTNVLLDQSVARSHAENTLDALRATSKFAELALIVDNPNQVSLPLSVDPPTYEVPAHALSSVFATLQPGSIGDGFFNCWDGFLNYGDCGWGYGFWYGDGRYDYAWGSWGVDAFYAGQFWGLGYGAWGASYAYGYWGYSPYAFGWGGWSSGYVTSPAGLGAGFSIDVDGSLAAYRGAVTGLISPLAAAAETLTTVEERGKNPAIDVYTGRIDLGDADATFGSIAQAKAQISTIEDQLDTSPLDSSSAGVEARPSSGLRTERAEKVAVSSRTSDPLQRTGESYGLHDRFRITLKGDAVHFQAFGQKSTTTTRGPRYSQVAYQPVQVGVRDVYGWVSISPQFGGGRATLTSFQEASNDWGDARTLLYQLAVSKSPAGTPADTPSFSATLQDVVNGVRSPFSYSSEPFYSDNIGIFIGGTAMHFYGVGNVERMYNSYRGNKFYYGGIGNAVDSTNESIDGGTGKGWNAIVDRVVADILRLNPDGSKRVHLFGWSRGAAQAAEVARRLAEEGLQVELFGNFDAVYSLGRSPGQGSDLITSTTDGRANNYVTRELSPNIAISINILAMNETRSWFPATRFVSEEGASNSIINIGSPGGHGEVGGHWASNAWVQQLNLTTMIGNAERYSTARFVFLGIDSTVQAIYGSPLTTYLVLKDVAEKGRGNAYDAWAIAQTTEQRWVRYSESEYVNTANSSEEKYWMPGALGVQGATGDLLPGNAAKTVPVVIVGPHVLVLDSKARRQPWRDHYRRQLDDWVSLGLWNTYDGIDKDNVRQYYDKILNPKGGWRTSWWSQPEPEKLEQ